MKLDIKIRFLVNCNTFEGETETMTVTVDCDYIHDHDDLVNAITYELGLRKDEFEIVNEEQFWKDMNCPASEITNPERGSFDPIRAVLRKYFEERSNGDLSKDYDPNFSAQDAIDEIANIVGHY